MNIEFVGADPKRVKKPGAQVVTRLRVDSVDMHHSTVTLLIRSPSKMAMDRGRATFGHGIAPQKEWIGRHVAHGLMLVHAQRELDADASTLRINLVSDFHIRSWGRNAGWDGRSVMTTENAVLLLTIELNRQDPTRRRTAEWRLYEGAYAISGRQLLNGGCAYTITATMV